MLALVESWSAEAELLMDPDDIGSAPRQPSSKEEHGSDPQWPNPLMMEWRILMLMRGTMKRCLKGWRPLGLSRVH